MSDRPQIIGKAEARLDPGSALYFKAALFRLPDEDGYILAGIGGSDTEFGALGGKGVVEMTESEAYNWAASHLPIDTVEEYFDHLTEEI